jgi:YesN/AraC family two-component response regulator
MARKPLDLEYFKKLVEQGLNCKQIAAKMGYHTHTFGLKIKKELGIYPSVYIAKRLKNK